MALITSMASTAPLMLANPAFALQMLDILQIVKYILFIDVTYPSIVRYFFKLFDAIDFGFVPKILND
jgi:hypothetical protein